MLINKLAKKAIGQQIDPKECELIDFQIRNIKPDIDIHYKFVFTGFFKDQIDRVHFFSIGMQDLSDYMGITSDIERLSSIIYASESLCDDDIYFKDILIHTVYKYSSCNVDWALESQFNRFIFQNESIPF